MKTKTAFLLLCLVNLVSCGKAESISFEEAKLRAHEILTAESTTPNVIEKRNEATIETETEELRFSLSNSYYARLPRGEKAATYLSLQEDGSYLLLIETKDGNFERQADAEKGQNALDEMTKDYLSLLALPTNVLSALQNLSVKETNQIQDCFSNKAGNLSFRYIQKDKTVSLAYENYLPVCYQETSDTQTITVSYQFGNVDCSLPSFS